MSLIPLNDYPARVSLIANSGIQFLNFGLPEQAPGDSQGHFVRKTANGPLLRLNQDLPSGKFRLESDPLLPEDIVKPEYSLSFADSLQILTNHWLPLPFFHPHLPGPDNWARVLIQRLDKADRHGNILRITLAFDTQQPSPGRKSDYLQPRAADIENGLFFSFRWQNAALSEFLDNTWVDGWLRESYGQSVPGPVGPGISCGLKNFAYQGHYLNILQLLATRLVIPEVQLVKPSPLCQPIDVDLILDVGNSHTCGIVIEDRPDKPQGLEPARELQIRYLSQPYRLSSPVFSSRIEFQQAQFGKAYFSRESGLSSAFCWPSMVRVGDEAHHLASCQQSQSGPSGMSSPRRYLWDSEATYQPWRFNQYGSMSADSQAICAPMMLLINDEGIPLASLPADQQIPAFSAQYSRSALMTQMLCELLCHAQLQINSVDSRLNPGLAHAPRRLRHLVLTLPCSMSKPERHIFGLRLKQAIDMLWSVGGWLAISPSPPQIQMDCDEATCGQLAWLYHEVASRYPDNPGELINGLARHPRRDNDKPRALRVASIDIGGGSTDLAIVDYRRDEGLGQNVKISPSRVLSEGYRLAGDELLFDIIHQIILPAISQALEQAGVNDTRGLMNKLFGLSPHYSHPVLRQQATFQLFIPLALALLAAWQKQPEESKDIHLSSSVKNLLSQPLTGPLKHYIQHNVQQALPSGAAAFDILNVPISLNGSALHNALFSGKFALSRVLQPLCRLIMQHDCDIVLISGGTSRLAAIRTFIQHTLALDEHRLIWQESYPALAYCPFNHSSFAGKSTAVIGAMLYHLARQLRLPFFNFNASAIKNDARLRVMGALDRGQKISPDNVWYQDIDLDDAQTPLDSRRRFRVSGNMTLGYRQQADSQWPASPLFSLSIIDPYLSGLIAGDNTLQVSLKKTGDNQSLELAGAWLGDGRVVPLEQITLTLNSQAQNLYAIEHYWIDSGIVYTQSPPEDSS